MAAPPSTPQQTRRGERRERTRMRGLLLCARHDGNSEALFRDSASEETQPKQAPLRPAPPQVLELPGGASRAVRMRKKTQPRLLLGSTWAKCSPRCTCRHQPIEEVHKALTTPTSQSGLSAHSLESSVSDFKVGSLRPKFFSVLVLFTSPEVLTHWRQHCG